MKKVVSILFMVLVFITTGCGTKLKQNNIKQSEISSALKQETANQSDNKITRHPDPSRIHNGSKLTSLPTYNPNSQDVWQLDLRGYDLSSLDLKDRISDLMFAGFDSNTIWPKSMPASFNPNKIMDLGKSPGLGLEELHKKGITGKDIGIAIIDQALLVDHIEYKDNLKMYEEIHCLDNQAQMHGPAVASIAVGKTVGVAPQADLYYIADTHGEDFTWTVKCIDRILEVNKSLPENKKIRVISISVGWSKDQKGYNEVVASVNKAKDQGVFVVSSSLFNTYGYIFNGLGRKPLKDPKVPSSYEPGLFWANEYYSMSTDLYNKRMHSSGIKFNEELFVPMDSRTTASPTGNNDYTFYRNGGWSWSIPYIAGLYSLACQVKPDITPDIFWAKALETGDAITVQHNNKEYSQKKIVNPVRLVESLRKN